MTNGQINNKIEYFKKELDFFEMGMNNVLNDGKPFIKDQK